MNVLVAIICNLVTVLIILGCILGAGRRSWKVSLVRLGVLLACGVGCYFATPALSSAICGIPVASMTLGVILAKLGISIYTLNSILFTAMFAIGYGFNSIICNLVKHQLIKSHRNKSENSAKIKRAKSINPTAERLARKAEWRNMKYKYAAGNRGLRKALAIAFNSLTAVLLSLVVLMPFGYIAEDMNAASEGSRSFLEAGFDCTLNGVIDEKIEFKVFDWLISADKQSLCEHSFEEGVCEHCGESEASAER